MILILLVFEKLHRICDVFNEINMPNIK